MGYRIRKPKTIDVLGHDHRTCEDELPEVSWAEDCPTWEQWSEEAEAWLGKKYGCEDVRFKGKGQGARLEKRLVSMPQDEEGAGCEKGVREEIVWIRKARRLAYLEYARENKQED